MTRWDWLEVVAAIVVGPLLVLLLVALWLLVAAGVAK